MREEGVVEKSQMLVGVVNRDCRAKQMQHVLMRGDMAAEFPFRLFGRGQIKRIAHNIIAVWQSAFIDPDQPPRAIHHHVNGLACILLARFCPAHHVAALCVSGQFGQ